jgi:glycerophosphoryl diester phosphodiesterase
MKTSWIIFSASSASENNLSIMMKRFSFTCFAVIAIACSSPKNNNGLNPVEFDKQGHRGSRGLMPENTIAAMYRGIDEDVNTLELDLHISKDKKVVVSHDPYFNELITTTPEGKFLSKEESRDRLLFSMNYDSIKKYDVGLKLHPDFLQQKKLAVYKPLFVALIDSSEIYAKQKSRIIHYNVEIKSKANTDNINHPAVPEFVELVVKDLNEKKITSRTVIQSFDMRPLQYLHAHYPNIKTSLLLEAKDNGAIHDLIQQLGFVPTIISPNFALATKEFIDDCHKLNIRVIPWTVNTLEEMKRLKALGVDGIISDYPNLFRQL